MLKEKQDLKVVGVRMKEEEVEQKKMLPRKRYRAEGNNCVCALVKG